MIRFLESKNGHGKSENAFKEAVVETWHGYAKALAAGQDRFLLYLNLSSQKTGKNWADLNVYELLTTIKGLDEEKISAHLRTTDFTHFKDTFLKQLPMDPFDAFIISAMFGKN